MYILEWKEKLKIRLYGENEEVLGKEEESKWTLYAGSGIQIILTF